MIILKKAKQKIRRKNFIAIMDLFDAIATIKCFRRLASTKIFGALGKKYRVLFEVVEGESCDFSVQKRLVIQK